MPQENSRVYYILQELVKRSGETSNRLRVVEQRIDGVESRLAALESANLEKAKKINARFIETEVTLRNLNDEILRIKNSIEKINQQMGKFARKREVTEIEKMVELLGPAHKLEQEIES